jgi:hypothetical protein
VKLVAFCEAPADFRLASGLVDRVLRESGPAWVADNLDTPGVVRNWHPASAERDYYDLHQMNHHADDLRKRGRHVRRVRGHFNGRPGEPGGAMARKAFLLVEALNRSMPDDPIDAVVLLWDTDEQQAERPEGVKAARDEAGQWAQFQMVCGFPDPEREAWLLAGFDPCDDTEQQVLDDLHRDLGFSPVVHAVRLRDKAGGALRNIKRVLGALIGDDLAREARCWLEPPLAMLRERGLDTGLSAFLDELDAVLPALLHGDPRR